ncbi:MAG: 50S ribosomal protein L23 [Gammaproteobacteria bacterium]|nr:50S ribosomal protein L23 [Gammaproteobacteria bacterium]
MSEERLMTVLQGPHVSEKSTQLADSHNQVVFRVRRDANKAEIRRAVEKLFEVEVLKVQVVNVSGKQKRFGRRAGRRAHWKKAYVRLAPGHDIEFLNAE